MQRVFEDCTGCRHFKKQIKLSQDSADVHSESAVNLGSWGMRYADEDIKSLSSNPADWAESYQNVRDNVEEQFDKAQTFEDEIAEKEELGFADNCNGPVNLKIGNTIVKSFCQFSPVTPILILLELDEQ